MAAPHQAGLSRLWKATPADGGAGAALAAALEVPLPVAALLAGRGLSDPAAAGRFLNPRLSDLSDPFLLPAMEPAADRILRAVRERERIVVYGDYDVDGVTSTALLVRVLTALGATVACFLPHRLEEGYGLSVEALTRCLDEHHPRLVVTVDCGTGSVEAAQLAAARGVDVIVTDHHSPGPALAPVLALVNPKFTDREELRSLAGVGVAFKLCHALLKKARSGGAADAVDLRDLLDLVALGTIADIVPLRDENRILARHGLACLNRTAKPGLLRLIEVAGIKRTIDAYEVGFQLGPRLNAAGRTGDAQRALRLLLTADADEALALARELDASNRERQGIEAEILERAVADIERDFQPERDYGLVVAGDGWHPGVIGIVAARITARYFRPTVVISFDGASGRGSCRSVDGFDLVQELSACSALLRKCGGHAMAAGLEIERSHLDDFRAAFNQRAHLAFQAAGLQPVQKIDAWIDFEEADDRLLEASDRLRPFGCGNPTPVWASRGVRVLGPPRTVGQGHLKLLLGGGAAQREAMGWNMADRPLPDGPLDVAYQLKRDTYMGRDKLVLTLQDFRPTSD